MKHIHLSIQIETESMITENANLFLCLMKIFQSEMFLFIKR